MIILLTESARDGRRVVAPGIVLVRQQPGSAIGVMFITIEDEPGVANFVLWADRFLRSSGVWCCRPA